MSDLSAAAAAMGIPESLVERSAEAKAAETGSSVEEILAAWAGGESAPAGAATETPAEPEAEDAEPEAAEATTEPQSETPPPAVSIEIPGDSPEAAPSRPGEVSRVEVPAEVTMAEAANLPVVVTVPTTGIKERTNFVVPKWLAALFFLVPLLALFALGGSATGVCGEATELTTNVITGEVVNCDGTPFEGSSVGGGGGADFIALGEAIYQGQEIGSVNCAGCHGAGGGGGVGPALNGVINVFGSCSDHIEWIELGTQGFQAAGRSTYGDTNKPVGGGGIMPGFSSLSAEQLAAVTAFERVRFGGASPDETLTSCGLVEAPAEGEEPPADGEGSADPVGDPPADTVPDQTEEDSSESSGDGA